MQLKGREETLEGAGERPRARRRGLRGRRILALGAGRVRRNVSGSIASVQGVAEEYLRCVSRSGRGRAQL